MRLFRSRPSGVVFGAIGSASALPSALNRDAFPTLDASIALAIFARAAESWTFDGKAIVLIG
jgi:hypothetical protein